MVRLGLGLGFRFVFVFLVFVFFYRLRNVPACVAQPSISPTSLVTHPLVLYYAGQGPMFGNLQKGQDITLRDGTVVRPSQVSRVQSGASVSVTPCPKNTAHAVLLYVLYVLYVRYVWYVLYAL